MLFGYAQLDGRGRPTEDRIAIYRLMDECHLFAVFDGHSGSAVVRMTTELLPKRIQTALLEKGADAASLPPSEIVAILRRCFIEHDKELAKNILKTRDSGSTASVAIVTPKHIIMAYAGDSPAFLLNPFSGMILHEIGKHEPTLLGESERIKAAGGTVEIDEYGTPRVDGSLMVSRAFGDFSLKFPENAAPPFEADWTKFKVTAYPDVTVWSRPTVGVLAIMSDGLVETETGVLKPHAQVAKDIQVALKDMKYDLMATAKAVNERHMRASVATTRRPYDGDDLSMILVDVGLKEANVVHAQGGGTLLAAAATAPVAGKPKTRKARHTKRNKTGKRTRIAKIFCLNDGQPV